MDVNKNTGKPECLNRWEELHELMEKAKLFAIVLGGPQLGGKNGFTRETADSLKEKDIMVYHLSTGDELRRMKDEKANQTMKEGNLVGSDIVMMLVQNRIKEICDNLLQEGIQPEHPSLLVLDGVPRTADQAEELHQMLGKRLKIVIVLDVSKEELRRRMNNVRLTCTGCGAVFSKYGEQAPQREGVCDHCGCKLSVRDDETPESLERRWGIYFSDTISALNSMHGMDYLLIHIDNDKGLAASVMSPVIAALLQNED